LHDGSPLIVDGNRVSVDDMIDGRWRLTIKDVQSSDGGKYSIVAENSAGQDITEATFTVKRM
jgi:hypothetical protein